MRQSRELNVTGDLTAPDQARLSLQRRQFSVLHWSDPTTRELRDLLIDLVPTLRVLMILSFRPEFTLP